MATPSASTATLIRDVVGLPGLRVEHPITMQALVALPDSGWDDRPIPALRSAGDLARHIVGAELRLLTGAARGHFPDHSAELAGIGAARALVDWYEPRFTSVVRELAALDGEALLRPLDYLGLVQMPALGFLQFAIQHTIHHRGQFSVFLRALGGGPAHIYG